MGIGTPTDFHIFQRGRYTRQRRLELLYECGDGALSQKMHRMVLTQPLVCENLFRTRWFRRSQSIGSVPIYEEWTTTTLNDFEDADLEVWAQLRLAKSFAPLLPTRLNVRRNQAAAMEGHSGSKQSLPLAGRRHSPRVLRHFR